MHEQHYNYPVEIAVAHPSALRTSRMIAFIEVPPAADLYDKELKTTAAAILQLLSAVGKPLRLDRNADLYTIARDGWVFITNGIFKCYYGNRLVRIYERGDLVVFTPLPGLPDEFTCSSEFGSEVTFVSADDVSQHLSAQPADSMLFIRHASLHATLMHILCAACTNDDFKFEFRLCEFNSGTVIIAEGAPALEIYQMIQGTATVTVKDVEVGKVTAGEVFGEISFFTGLARSATVTARTMCTVQVMSKENFLTLARMKPSVNIAVSKTLSQRLVETNRRLTENAT